MDRRQFLSLAGGSLAATALAGCMGPDMGGDCPTGTDFDMDTEPVSELAVAHSRDFSRFHSSLQDVLQTAMSEPVVRREPEHPYLDDGTFFNHEQSYYEIQLTEQAQYSAQGYYFDLEMDADTEPSGEGIAFTDLSEYDKQTFLRGIGYSREKLLHAEGFSGRLVAAYHTEERRENSVFTSIDPGISYIDYQGKSFQLSFEKREEVPVVEYTVESVRVAESHQAFFELRRDEYGVDFDAVDLSSEAVAVIEAAISDGGYSGCEPYSDGFAEVRSVVEEELGETHRLSYAKYDGEWYSASMMVFTV